MQGEAREESGAPQTKTICQALQKANVNPLLREARPSDLGFLRRMLYEAIFWRSIGSAPSLEEGLAYPDVSNLLADWGRRAGDTAVVATVDSTPIGASWYRFWTDDNPIRGYIDEATPVLVIGVHTDYRHLGIGTKMIEWLVHRASEQAIERISLMVSKDNYAIHLYRQQGFVEYADNGDAFVMVRNMQS